MLTKKTPVKNQAYSPGIKPKINTNIVIKAAKKINIS